MFKPEYIFFDHVLTCHVEQVGTWHTLEKDAYPFFKKFMPSWKYHRVDTVNQQGFPDVLLLRGELYWTTEVKRLKQKKLLSVEDSLTWQFGQLAYAKRAFTLSLNYIITVVKHNNIAFIGDKKCLDKFLLHLHF